MSTHGEEARSWAPPFETETPDPAEIREEEEEARAEERVPARDGQGGDVERGTLCQTDQEAGGYEAQTDQGEEEDMFGIAPPSPGTRRRAESVLETPRGRELFNEFLEQLARQPAPSEEPTQSGTTIDAPVGITATTIPRLRQGVVFSMDPSRPSLQPVGNARGDVPMVTPAHATSDRRTQSGEGVPASGLSHQGSGQAQGLVQSRVKRPGAAGAATRASASAGGRGTLPVQSTETPTVRTGTSTANPALQAFLVNTLSQALQRFSVMGQLCAHYFGLHGSARVRGSVVCLNFG
ncbi:hypothetical protein PC129_g16951 [Phytophthora cactorum]|uniref:Uncharacterized protein n=1 Tax=Phytophthora cactorum TaxID=29920 RepID=A0A8T1HHJ7_9STRA|nr:hypothetical protein C6341_g19741 [Phytophthora cactorum]KAG3212085.1 hypothetical protein PC129_g16951 [Phytophthora cactorum]